jgi:predicted GIY-YIG superfamily endonuclease
MSNSMTPWRKRIKHWRRDWKLALIERDNPQ